MTSRLRIGFVVAVLAGFPAGAAAQPAPIKSKITVVVPDAGATLTIEGAETKARGNVRLFETPTLEAGREYEYALKAVWRPNNYTVITRSRSVRFKAGEDVTADLTTEDSQDKIVIRFVPTPPDIVDKMVELAEIGPDDVVYEPGCGDARITIAAVQAGAKRGVGIDIDPERVAEAKVRVRQAGLEDKVEIRLGDALEIKDLNRASVVFLYMGDEFDELIRPILWKQLNVGSRVVSHRFLMGDWKPDKSVTVKGVDDDDYVLHLWTVTEDVKKRADAPPTSGK